MGSPRQQRNAWEEWEDNFSMGWHGLSCSCESPAMQPAAKNGLKRNRPWSSHRVPSLYYFCLQQKIAGFHLSNIQSLKRPCLSTKTFWFRYSSICLRRDGIQLLCFSALTWNFLCFGSDPPAKSELVWLQSPKPWCHPGEGRAMCLKMKGKNQWIEANNLLVIMIVHCPTLVGCAVWEAMGQHELALILTAAPEV